MSSPNSYMASAVFGVDNREYHTAVGIEIEYENFRRTGGGWNSVLWNTANDGSLREGGVEFISVPISPHDIPAAFEALRGGFKAGFECRPSFRCGVHVHLNMTEFNMDEFMAVCSFYALIEPTLMDYSGEERQDNIFCVPWYHTPQQSSEVFQQMRTHMYSDAAVNTVANVLQSNTNKYQALNLRPMWDLGTIEFRMAPTWDDLDRVQDWVASMARIRECAVALGSPERVMEEYRTGRLEGLLEMIGLPAPGERLEYTDEAEDVAEALCYEPLTKDDIEWDYPDTFTRVNPEIVARDDVDEDPVLDRGPEFGMATFDEALNMENQRRFTVQAHNAVEAATMRRAAEAMMAAQQEMENTDAPVSPPRHPIFERWDEAVRYATPGQINTMNGPNTTDNEDT